MSGIIPPSSPSQEKSRPGHTSGATSVHAYKATTAISLPNCAHMLLVLLRTDTTSDEFTAQFVRIIAESTAQKADVCSCPSSTPRTMPTLTERREHEREEEYEGAQDRVWRLSWRISLRGMGFSVPRSAAPVLGVQQSRLGSHCSRRFGCSCSVSIITITRIGTDSRTTSARGTTSSRFRKESWNTAGRCNGRVTERA